MKRYILIALILLGVVSLTPHPAVSDSPGAAPMSTVFEILLQAARNLEAIVESKATSNGTTTTLYDTGLATMYRDDDFNGGALFIKQNAAVGFTPRIVVVTDFTSATGKIDFAAGQITSATALNDLYGVMAKRYPAYLLRQKLNELLREIKTETEVLTGDPPGYFSCASLVNGQMAWTDVRTIQRIEFGRASATDRQWRPVTRWALNGGLLRFNDPSIPDSADYVLRITVIDTLDEVTSDSATIPDKYPVEWLSLEVALKCARWRLFQAGKDDKQLTTLINDLMTRRDKARARVRLASPFTWQQAQEWPEC